MQLYVGDYLGDTRHLTTEQHGAYLLLLMAMWSSEGELPNDEAKLARMAGVGLAKWRKIGPDVTAFFTVEGAVITQKRLRKEREKWESKSATRREAGKRGGDAKALKEKGPHVANAIPIATILPQQKASIYHIPSPEEVVDVDTSTTAVRGKRGSRISPDWKERDEERQWARERGWSSDEIDDAAVRFRDYWLTRTRDATKTDWDRTFLNRLKDLNDRRKQGPPRNGGRAPQHQREIEALRELDDEISDTPGASGIVHRLSIAGSSG